MTRRRSADDVRGRGSQGLVALIAAALVLAWAVLAAPGRALALDVPIVNVAPVALADAYNAVSGTTLTVAAPGVLKNDVDLDLDSLTAILVDGSGNGSLDLDADGGFTFKSGESFAGDRTFTYRAWDGSAFSAITTVTIHVAAKPAPTRTPTPAPTATPTPTPLPVPTVPLPSIGPLPSIVLPLPTPAPTETPSPRVSATPGPTPSGGPSTNPGSPDPTDRSGAPPVVAGIGGDDGSGGDPGPPTGGGGRPPIEVGRLDGPPIEVLDLGDVGIVDVDTVVDWAIPSLVLGVPGLLLIVAVGAQVLGGLFWVPVVRRWLGGFGVRHGVGVRRRESSAP